MMPVETVNTKMFDIKIIDNAGGEHGIEAEDFKFMHKPKAVRIYIEYSTKANSSNTIYITEKRLTTISLKSIKSTEIIDDDETIMLRIVTNECVYEYFLKELTHKIRATTFERLLWTYLIDE